MALIQLSCQEIVERSVNHRLGIPEFQRGFVWSPAKVLALAESLWNDYPIGTLLLWKSDKTVEPRVADTAQPTESWVVDGQQRITALCLLFGRKPYYWPNGQDWNEAATKRYDVRFNPIEGESGKFSLSSAVIRKDANWLPVRELINANDDKLSDIAEKIRDRNPTERFGQIYSKLDRIRGLKERTIVGFEETKDLEEIVEIFARINQNGTKVTEGDVFLALTASKNPGWIREEFLPFADDLEESGFDLEPHLVFRSVTVMGEKKARFKDVPDTFWESGVEAVWQDTKSAWQKLLDGIRVHGILSDEILPSKNALIPLTLMCHKFRGEVQFSAGIAWLLHSTRESRYSGSSMTALDEDIRTVDAASNFCSAIDNLRSNLPRQWSPFSAEDFHGDYRDSFLRLFFYLLVYSQEAKDWGSGQQRLGFEGTAIFNGFKPDWHHIFPRKHLRDNKIPEENMNQFANIAIVRPQTNIRIGKNDPMRYLETYDISDDLLEQQFIPTDRSLFKIDHYHKFLEARAELLVTGANDFFKKLESGEA